MQAGIEWSKPCRKILASEEKATTTTFRQATRYGSRPWLHGWTVSCVRLVSVAQARFPSDTTHSSVVTSKSSCRRTAPDSGSGPFKSGQFSSVPRRQVRCSAWGPKGRVSLDPLPVFFLSLEKGKKKLKKGRKKEEEEEEEERKKEKLRRLCLN